ncbi:MAG TPA: thermonuclease family protein [Candidatus Baltobacteraceae bacterium]|nr:thermonuclease family protein [Candidatus Baltobacteraceae bacterium]
MAAARVVPAVPGWVRGVGCGCLFLCWWVSSARAAGSDSTLWGTVTEVHSATQLTLSSPDSGLVKVRLAGVAAPEPANPNGRGEARLGQPFGDQTLAYIRNLLLGKQVQVKSYGTDQGRVLGVVWLGDINVNVELVKQGLAWMETAIQNVAVRAPLEVAERQAQVGRYGFWDLPNPEPPWEFRRRNRLPAE